MPINHDDEPDSGWSIKGLYNHVVNNKATYVEIGTVIASMASKLAPLILIKEDAPKQLDVSDILFRLNDIMDLRDTDDTSLNQLIATFNSSRHACLLHIKNTGTQYIYPPPVFTPCEEVVVPTNVMATWALLRNPSVNVPEMTSSVQQPFILV